MKMILSFMVSLVLLLMFTGCDQQSLFEESYPYAFFCQDDVYGKTVCKMTASPDIRYSQSEKQSLLYQMDILESSLAQAGRLADGFASVHMHFALGAPMTIKISETSGIPLLGNWKNFSVYSYIGDAFSKVVNKETAKTKKTQRTKKEDLTDILFTPNPRTKNAKKEVKEEKETKKNPTKTSEAKKKSKNKVVKARKIDMDDSYVDTKSKRVLKPKVSKVFTILSDILYWVIFIFIVVLLFIVCVQRFSNNELSIGGIRIYNVSTESMASKYAVGDIILAKDVDPSTLRVGDDIAYNGKGDQLEGKIITHEIQSISQNEDNSYTIITKGIENDIEDPAINSSQIKGKIIRKLPILSAISRVASNNFGLFFAIFIPVAVIIFINMIRIMNASDEEE